MNWYVTVPVWWVRAEWKRSCFGVVDVATDTSDGAEPWALAPWTGSRRYARVFGAPYRLVGVGRSHNLTDRVA